MWLQFIDFAMSQRAEKRLSTLFPRALQLHPRHTALWLHAAEWQSRELGNTTAARVLFQRALRLNPSAEALWLEYFRLEWYFIKKLGARRNALGLDPQADAFYQGAVPLTVFENAIKALPQSLGLRRDFLQLCGDFEGSDAVHKAILESIAKDFKDDPEGWAVRATSALEALDMPLTSKQRKKKKNKKRKLLEGSGEGSEQLARSEARLSDGEQAAIRVLEQGLSELASNPAMWRTYAEFLCHRWALAVEDDDEGEDDGGSSHHTSRKASLLATRLDNLFQRGHTAGALTPSLVVSWSRLPVVGHRRAEVILRQGLSKDATSVQLWQALLHLCAWNEATASATAANAGAPTAKAAKKATQATASAEANATAATPSSASSSSSLDSVLEEAFRALGSRPLVATVEFLYQPLLEAALLSSDPTKAHQLFAQAFKRCPGNPPTVVAAQYVRWAFSIGGPDGTAQAYRSIRAAYPGGHRALIPCALECATLLADASAHEELVRSAYESVVRWQDGEHNEDAWSMYAAWEQKRNHLDKADAVRWRAQRA